MEEQEPEPEPRRLHVEEYRNVIAGAIVSVLLGGILLALGVVILSDFFQLADESGGYIANNTTVQDGVGTAFGLGAIGLVVPIVGGIITVLMGSFGGMLGGGGRGR